MAKNNIDLATTTPLKDKIAYPFKVVVGAIKNFFYDISVVLHNFFRKITGADKRVKKNEAKHKKIGETIFVWLILCIRLVTDV